MPRLLNHLISTAAKHTHTEAPLYNPLYDPYITHIPLASGGSDLRAVNVVLEMKPISTSASKYHLCLTEQNLKRTYADIATSSFLPHTQLPARAAASLVA